MKYQVLMMWMFIKVNCTYYIIFEWKFFMLYMFIYKKWLCRRWRISSEQGCEYHTLSSCSQNWYLLCSFEHQTYCEAFHIELVKHWVNGSVSEQPWNGIFCVYISDCTNVCVKLIFAQLHQSSSSIFLYKIIRWAHSWKSCTPYKS